MSNKLQLDGRYRQSVVAPSGERLRGKGRHGVIHICVSSLEVLRLDAILIHFTFTARRGLGGAAARRGPSSLYQM